MGENFKFYRELLQTGTATGANTSDFRPGENHLTSLRRRRHEINDKLLENQRLLDKVTDVESAR